MDHLHREDVELAIGRDLQIGYGIDNANSPSGSQIGDSASGKRLFTKSEENSEEYSHAVSRLCASRGFEFGVAVTFFSAERRTVLGIGTLRTYSILHKNTTIIGSAHRECVRSSLQDHCNLFGGIWTKTVNSGFVERVMEIEQLKKISEISARISGGYNSANKALVAYSLWVEALIANLLKALQYKNNLPPPDAATI